MVTGALLLLLMGALGVALITARTVVGAVPGRSPILGMAAIDDGFLVGTGRGAFVSRDGRSWSQVGALTSSRALVADGHTEAFVLAQGTVRLTSDLLAFTDRSEVGGAVAVAVESDDTVYVLRDVRHALRLSRDMSREITFSSGPKEIVALAVTANSGLLLAGGLTSGLWESRDEGVTWRRLLETPTRAIMVDPARKGRIFIGTAGGILISNDGGRRWRFTGMRLPVEALAESGGRFFAISTDRLIYESTDGLSWSMVTS